MLVKVLLENELDGSLLHSQFFVLDHKCGHLCAVGILNEERQSVGLRHLVQEQLPKVVLLVVSICWSRARCS